MVYLWYIFFYDNRDANYGKFEAMERKKFQVKFMKACFDAIKRKRKGGDEMLNGIQIKMELD